MMTATLCGEKARKCECVNNANRSARMDSLEKKGAVPIAFARPASLLKTANSTN